MGDWQKRTLKSSIIHIVVLIVIVLATNCNQHLSEEPEITEAQRRQNTKLMPFSRHSMMVPLGTQIGDTITAHDGLWLSKQACARMAPYMIWAEKNKKDANQN